MKPRIALRNRLLCLLSEMGGLSWLILHFFFVTVPCTSVESKDIGRTFFQTNVAYDERVALDTDFVVVHQHGNPQVGKAIASWKEAGYPVGRMFFIGSDAGRIYTGGKFDGTPHPDEAETDRNGKIFECAGVRPYMVPTEGWKKFVRAQVRLSIDAGAEAILPEEPLAHTKSGYSSAFKHLWTERFGEPWKPPHTSADAFFKANRLKSDLYYELVETALVETKRYSEKQGKEVRFLLPIHSLLSHAAGRMLYPSGRSLNLAEKGLDGFVGQVWTGPIAWSMSRAEGYPMSRDKDFFESGYLLYSYFANLVRGTDLDCYLLADPVEDNPEYSWDEYRTWYRKSVVAMTCFPWMNRFEVMPWPDRVFLPGYQMATGTPGPEGYRRALMCAFSALTQLPSTPDPGEQEGPPVVGLLVTDTLSWQMGGPEGASMASVHGLTVPLLRRGIPTQVVPLERHADSSFLDRFRILILSYDAMKPLDPSMNRDLAKWVRGGGKLLIVGGADLYNEVDEWWIRAGYRTPLDPLMEDLGIWTPKDERFFFRGPQEIRSATTLFNSEGLDRIKLARNWVLTDYHFPKAEHLYNLVGKRSTPLCGVVASMQVGDGGVLFCGIPSAWFGESEVGGELVLKLVQHAGRLGKKIFSVEPQSRLEVRRGPFLVVHGCTKNTRLEGQYLDVLNENLPILNDPLIPVGGSFLLLELGNRLKATSTESRLLFGGPQARNIQESPDSIRFFIRSPGNTPATVRLACRGSKPLRAIVNPIGSDEGYEPKIQEYDSETDSLLLVFPVGPQGGILHVDWTDKH